jgi:hypothetical protein
MKQLTVTEHLLFALLPRSSCILVIYSSQGNAIYLPLGIGLLFEQFM